MAKYQYVDAADKLQTVEAASAEAAMAAAKNIGKSSGVMLVPPKVDKVTTSTDAAKLGKGSLPDVPPVQPSGSAADLAYSIGSSMPGVQDAKNAAAAFAPAAGPIETSYAELVRSMQQDISSIAGKSKTRAELLQEEGVNANKELINQYTQQLQREQQALKKTTDALYEGEAGFMTSGYADKKAQDIQRRSLSKQADIAIAANAAQGNIDTALELVDQKLQIKYGEAEDRLALQKQYIELLSPLMSAEQQRTATARQNELSLYAADLSNKRELERMDYQAKLDQQQASYEASLKAPTAESGFDVTGDSSSYRAALESAMTGAGLSNASMENNRNLLEKYLAAGQTERAKDLVRRNIFSSLGAADESKVKGRYEAVSALSDIESALAEYKASGGSTNIGKGSIESLAQKLGTSSDPKLANLGVRMNLALNAYTNAISGAAFTEQEAARYAALFPNWNNTGELNAEKISGLRNAFDAVNRGAMRYVIGDTEYDALFAPKTASIPDSDWNDALGSAGSSGALTPSGFYGATGGSSVPSSSSAGVLTLPADFSGFSNALFK